jgi:hypothetical protein
LALIKLQLSTLENSSTFIGDKLNIRAKYIFEEDTSVLWSGVQLITNPPCAKELQISKEEIFSKGTFEAGEYIRERDLLINSNVVPTIKNRDINYSIKLSLSQSHPNDTEKDLIINQTQLIELKQKPNLSTKLPNPISFSLSGLNVLLSKDIFKPGETIKISFSSEVLKQLEIRLLQNANLVCFCNAYGNNCSLVEELPPAIAGDAKTTNIDRGFLLLKVPEIAEPSHNFLWESIEKEQFGARYGDYSKWSLLIIGKKKPEFGREPINFEVPITIVPKRFVEKKIGENLFSKADSGSHSLFDGLSSKFQKIYKVISINSDLENYKLKIKNISDTDLNGVTVTVAGLHEGLFETAPNLTGFNSWEKNEEKEINYKTEQNISAVISEISDNTQKKIKIQTPISSNFF